MARLGLTGHGLHARITLHTSRLRTRNDEHRLCLWVHNNGHRSAAELWLPLAATAWGRGHWRSGSAASSVCRWHVGPVPLFRVQGWTVLSPPFIGRTDRARDLLPGWNLSNTLVRGRVCQCPWKNLLCYGRCTSRYPRSKVCRRSTELQRLFLLAKGCLWAARGNGADLHPRSGPGSDVRPARGGPIGPLNWADT